MKHYKFFLSLIILCAFYVNANAQKEIPDSTEVLFDSNGSFTRVINTPEEVDAKLKSIMINIYNAASTAAKEYGCEGNLVAGANIAGFLKVAEAMKAQGIAY